MTQIFKALVVGHYRVTVLFDQGNEMLKGKLEMAQHVEMAGLNKMKLYKMDILI